MNTVTEKYLIFKVDEEYALDVGNVIEIIEMTDITRVPDAPEYVTGIINLRGHVVPVIDMRKRFRKPKFADSSARCIVIAEIDDNMLGLIVDTVVDLIDIDSGLIKEPPRVGTSFAYVFVKGIGIIAEKMHLIIDADKLINYNDLNFMEHESEESSHDSDSKQEE